jgi:hypothetical protein
MLPPALRSSSLWRRAMPATVSLAQGDFSRTMWASRSDQSAAGLFYQLSSEAAAGTGACASTLIAAGLNAASAAIDRMALFLKTSL